MHDNIAKHVHNNFVMEEGRRKKEEGAHTLNTHQCIWYQYLKELNAIRIDPVALSSGATINPSK
jgi:hypothetical protein